MLQHAHKTVVPKLSTLLFTGGGGVCVLLAEPVFAGMITGEVARGDPFGAGEGDALGVSVFGVCGEFAIFAIGVDGIAFGLAGST